MGRVEGLESGNFWVLRNGGLKPSSTKVIQDRVYVAEGQHLVDVADVFRSPELPSNRGSLKASATSALFKNLPPGRGSPGC